MRHVFERCKFESAIWVLEIVVLAVRLQRHLLHGASRNVRLLIDLVVLDIVDVVGVLAALTRKEAQITWLLRYQILCRLVSFLLLNSVMSYPCAEMLFLAHKEAQGAL